jgi:hypothetical protein
MSSKTALIISTLIWLFVVFVFYLLEFAILPKIGALFSSLNSMAVYALPIFPLVTRGLLFLIFRDQLSGSLQEAEADVGTYKSLIPVLMGFSFTGSLALFVVDAKVQFQANLQIPAFYLLTSFLFYFIALNLQDYKFSQAREYFLGQGLIDSASLSLMSSIVSIVLMSEAEKTYKYMIIIFVGMAWLCDHFYRLYLLFLYLKAKRNALKRRIEHERERGQRRAI